MVQNILKNKYFIFALRLFVGVIFIYASLSKIQNPWQFAAIIESYRLVSPLISHYLALFLPFLELICALVLIIGVFVRGSAFLLSSMLVVFIVVISLSLLRGLEIDCGCFDLSETGDLLSFKRIIEDILLLAASIIILFYYKLNKSFLLEYIKINRGKK